MLHPNTIVLHPNEASLRSKASESRGCVAEIYQFVITGLVPVIHVLLLFGDKDVDGRA